MVFRSDRHTVTLLRRILLAALLLVSASRALAEMVHRWSFNEAAASSIPSGSTFPDPISGAAATVRSGTGSTLAGLSGSALSLPGSSTGNQSAANISAYLDLPNGIISSKANFTVEAWITPLSSQSWQPLFVFGRANLTVGAGAATGEILDGISAPGAYTPWDEIALSLNNAATLGNHRSEGRLANATKITGDINLSATTVAGTEYHYVLTVTDGAGAFGSAGCQAAFYRNGVLQKTTDFNFHTAQISDVNNWIGRPQNGADRCSNFGLNELRIYNHALSAAEVLASMNAGPNPAFTPALAVDDAFTMHRNQKARLHVLANDTGDFTRSIVTIVTPPEFGNATPDASGNVLYAHTSGAPASDHFTYRISGPLGASPTATVTITFANTPRLANPELNVPGSPPALATQLQVAFTGLSNPTCMASPPSDTARLFVCQKAGLLRVIENVAATTPTISTFLNLPALLTSRGETINTTGERGLLGLAFHPNYAANRQFYIFYSVLKNSFVYERVSRFTALAGSPNVADSTSELVLLEQLDEANNHNGGDLHFGPDGYLYISVGDEGNANDSLNNSQQIDKDIFSALLRIDVDKKPGSLEPNFHSSVPTDGGIARYSVPKDNPFVHTSLGGSWNGAFNGTPIATLAGVHHEFWAVGLRNPWRFSFDSATGELWLGDVGQDAYEEIDIITKGGNYGWAYREAFHNGPKAAAAPANFGALYHTPPIYEYPHTAIGGGDTNYKGDSCTGGVVYRGGRFPSLVGAYIFADYVSGNIWSLRRDGTNPPVVTRIAGETGIVAFGTDPSNGDVLLADYNGSRILRLTVETVTDTYPTTLSATGLFADLTDLSPAPGVLPYAPNLPFWSDFALKRRWFVIPSGSDTMTWSRDGAWAFPAGQIWVKHFDLETTRGNPATSKRIETRILVKNTTDVYGVSYRWNDAGTEATLAPEGGADFDLNITVGGASVSQHWRIPSRSDCLACHTAQAGYALSFNTRQLNLANTINGFSGNQLSLFAGAGYFGNAIASPNLLPRHVRADETNYSLEARVRSYLAVNCAYCHQSGGSAAPAEWDGRHELTLEQTGLLNGFANEDGGNALNKLVVPGDTVHSVLLKRISGTSGFSRMPPIASSELDQTNIDLVSAWIATALPGRQFFGDWRQTNFGNTTSAEGEAAADPDGDSQSNFAEFLWKTLPFQNNRSAVPQIAINGPMITLSATLPADRSAIVETSLDLATWFTWDVPGNAGIPAADGTLTLSGSALGATQFFRVKLKEN